MIVSVFCLSVFIIVDVIYRIKIKHKKEITLKSRKRNLHINFILILFLVCCMVILPSLLSSNIKHYSSPQMAVLWTDGDIILSKDVEVNGYYLIMNDNPNIQPHVFTKTNMKYEIVNLKSEYFSATQIYNTRYFWITVDSINNSNKILIQVGLASDIEVKFNNELFLTAGEKGYYQYSIVENPNNNIVLLINNQRYTIIM